MNLPKRLLICGLGSMGRYYIKLLKRKWPDINISVLRSGHNYSNNGELKVENIFFNKHEALKWKPDYCIIASPAPYHLEQALFFGNQGISILIEKPIGIPFQAIGSWDKLLSLCKSKSIFVGYVLRQHPAVNLIKNYLEHDSIGKIIEADFYAGSWLPNWRPLMDYRQSVSAKRNLGGGVLLELSHEIDLALYLFKSFDIKYAFMDKSKTLDIEVEDKAYLLGQNNYGTTITIRLNFCTNIERRTLLIRGSQGEILWDINKGELSHSVKEDQKKYDQFKTTKDDIFELQLTKFFNSQFNTSNNLCTVQEGISVLKIIERSFKIKE